MHFTDAIFGKNFDIYKQIRAFVRENALFVCFLKN